MSPKILIVDDDPSNIVTLESMLIPEGYALSSAFDGDEAVVKAKEVLPDVILLDVMMPRLNGFEACRRIRADPVIGRVPVLMLTALDDSESRLEGLGCGADDFISKPCRREELRARVRTVVSLNRFRLIAEQRERFQRLFDLAPDPIVLVNRAGQVLGANDLGRSVLVRDNGGVEADHLADAFAAPEDTAVRGWLNQLTVGVEPGALTLSKGTGALRRVFIARGTLVPDQGVPACMVVLSDITAEVLAREALEKLNRELDDLVRARTQQLEDANQLLLSYANFVSHDLRSPLSAVTGCLSLVVDDPTIPAEAKTWIEQGYQGALNLGDLITNILQLAQDEHRGTTSFQMVDPAPVITRVAERLCSMQRPPRPKLMIGPLPLLNVSAILVERVFYNLVGNAMKYSAHRPQPLVEIGCSGTSPEGNAILFVRDNGVGFGAAESERLFKEFSRLSTSEGREGLGLGLSLVARLIKSHHGRIWAEGTPGEGATFFVELPAATIEAPPVAVTPAGL